MRPAGGRIGPEGSSCGLVVEEVSSLFPQLRAWLGRRGRAYASWVAIGEGCAAAMAKIVVVGAGVVGLGAALLLCRDGHEVTVLERDAEAPPVGADAIWGSWQRKGVNQFRLPHFFLARYGRLLDSELPEVKEALVAAGAVCLNPVLDAPEALRGSAREEDGAFECISAGDAWLRQPSRRWPAVRIWRSGEALPSLSSSVGLPLTAACRMLLGFAWTRVRR